MKTITTAGYYLEIWRQTTEEKKITLERKTAVPEQEERALLGGDKKQGHLFIS